MAVQKSRKTRSKRGMRRSHDNLRAPVLSKDPVTGETHLWHHISPEGYYKGRKIITSEESYKNEE
ncbi:50S ribosomal protein L32 [Coxiella endosymbiont of Rhipicephalus microplus]|uniref:50S ribosomal protein L32 n=1 Tax=Coxiella endosymbiont of Rhipicephalus microplus TaxID=1656186 RepID=UPI000C7FD1E6|nr:50S ribosomal protein L32 [Coxiella endosymbiont of Rhipicephalus microplus]PMB54892.1 LSU ribosomal protein L32p [Coxiella-like endosymbiont]